MTFEQKTNKGTTIIVEYKIIFINTAINLLNTISLLLNGIGKKCSMSLEK